MLRPEQSIGSLRVYASWEEAIEIFNTRLTKDEKKKLNTKNCKHGSYLSFHQAAVEAKTRVDKARPPWMSVMENILSTINRYAQVGDLIVQHHAEYTSLAWGAFRFLVLFVANETSTASKLALALEKTLSIFLHAKEYARLFERHAFSTTATISESLQKLVTNLYAEILNFLVRATIFFDKSLWRRTLSAGISPFDAKFQDILNRIETLESTVEKDAKVLNLESQAQTESLENGIWLKHANFEPDVTRLRQEHLEKTCLWLFDQQEYLTWRHLGDDTSSSSLLWIQGKPGCGKSVIAAQIVEDLQQEQDSTTAYAFCKKGDEDKNSLLALLRNLVFQLYQIESQRGNFQRIVLLERMAAQTPIATSIDQLWRILDKFLSTSIRACFVIDGLDECNSTERERSDFLCRFVDTVRQSKGAVKLLVISRLDEAEIAQSGDWTVVQITPLNCLVDITRYVASRLQDSEMLSRHPQRDELQKTLVERANGMILWSKLMIEELEAARWNVDGVLQHPPEGLYGIYTEIFSRLESSAKKYRKVSLILPMVLAAMRPLHVHEIALGLAISEGLRSHDDYDTMANPEQEGKRILLDCNPLLILLPDQTVELIHASLEEYLLREQDSMSICQDRTGRFSFTKAKAHSALASTSIAYLSLETFRDLSIPQDAEVLGRRYALLRYSSEALVHHCVESSSSDIAKRVVAFFDTIQGWKWLDLLTDQYGVSYGQLQLWQSQLRVWSENMHLSDEALAVLSHCFLLLEQKRCNHIQGQDAEGQQATQAMSDLSNMYRLNGELEKAEQLDTLVLERRRQKLGEEHLDTLTAKANLFTTLWDQGKLNEAKIVGSQAWNARRKILGDEHESSLTIGSNLGGILADLGLYHEAEELLVKIVQTKKECLGDEHPSTLISILTLASIYGDQGDLCREEVLELEVIEARKRIYGDDHPDTLSAKSNLASTYSVQERWEESLILTTSLVQTQGKVFGDEHPNTMRSKLKLVACLYGSERAKEAEELLGQVLSSWTTTLGPDHPDTLNAQSLLARSLMDQEQWKQAEEVTLQVLSHREKTLGAMHPDTQTTRGNLADIKSSLGDKAAARLLYEQVLAVSEQSLGGDHPKTVQSMVDLAFLLADLEAWDEAERLENRVLDARKCALGEEHPDTLVAMSNLGITHVHLGNGDEALRLHQAAFEGRRKVLGEEDEDTRQSREWVEILTRYTAVELEDE
ncbi:MAG: hypothetical protein M1833_005322 [Piccolia ochrophora]|nr:MAG: hypothetical protein M1833_005322 [Piccolia ochrophora]